MWNAISNMIIKAADNMNRGVENAATSSGEGNNGQNYQTSSSNGGGGSPGGYSPTSQDMSSTSNAASAGKALTQQGASMLKNIPSGGGDNDNTTSTTSGKGNASTTGQNPEYKGASTSGGMDSVKGIVGTQMPIASDERLKRIFGDNEDAIDVFSKINAIEFEYNDKAKEIHPDGENNVDDDVHYGIKAQDLEKSPITSSVVSEDDYGYKQVNTEELTMVNSAVISDLCKRIKILENILGVKVV